jgi:hypothetical protein
MGMIRKSLFVLSAGAVRPSSKKQRVAKATLKQNRKQTRLMARQTRLQERLAKMQEVSDH